MSDNKERMKQALEEACKEVPEADAIVKRFVEHLYISKGNVELVLKCHLLIEEVLTEIIRDYLLHPEFVDQARLTFAQKVNIARSMSVDQQKNPVWKVVASFNRLRNDYGHSLEPVDAEEDMKWMRKHYLRNPEFAGEANDSDEVLLKNACIFVLGFLGSFHSEVKRYRMWLKFLDRVANRHTHEPAKGKVH